MCLSSDPSSESPPYKWQQIQVYGIANGTTSECKHTTLSSLIDALVEVFCAQAVSEKKKEIEKSLGMLKQLIAKRV